jgi:hypothetical protein
MENKSCPLYEASMAVCNVNDMNLVRRETDSSESRKRIYTCYVYHLFACNMHKEYE